MGFQCEVSPSIDADLYKLLYYTGSNTLGKIAAIPRILEKRRADVRRAGDFDVVVVQKGTFPGLYSGFERRIARSRPLVFDFDDAIWLPRPGGSAIARALHRESTVADIIRCATAVTAGNEFLASYTRSHNPRVTVVPIGIDLSKYCLSDNSDRIGWIGSSTTLPYLRPLKSVFEALDTKPRVIATGNPNVLGFDVDFVRWQSDTETKHLAEIGIGLVPLADTPWERGKSGGKLLQYFAAGIPVVASPVGLCAELVQSGVNGYLANTTSEWIQALETLRKDPDRRAAFGRAGRKLIETRFDLDTVAQQMAEVIRAAARRA